ncbi:UDP-N-acetylmuramoyl-L-alanine--D-glutamate ligase [Candidatus Babeliales bacterium]|nr:UDP-N-acetylmuramoyl-L-alanine--D-glutamate ligase [Candidatus Babeliales bacterium]
MNNQYHTYGILGFGVVGKSVLRHLSNQSPDRIAVYDSRKLSQDENTIIRANNGVVYQPSALESFLIACEHIIPSPGIALHRYDKYSHKWLSELDLFAHAWHKHVIAITGTVGKTTTAALLAHTLEHIGEHVGLGGNIGTPMLDLVSCQETYALAVLELSSFQLMHMKEFAPDIAVLLNLYPNHLDYHTSYDEYKAAKLRLFTNQSEKQNAIIPLFLKDALKGKKAHTIIVTPNDQLCEEEQQITFAEHNGNVTKKNKGHKESIIRLGSIPPFTVTENLVFITAILDTLKIDPMHLINAASTFPPQEHRMEYVLERDGVTIYNDSKATLPEATLAALNRLGNRPTILIIGGLSKGVDRTPFFTNLPPSVRHIICFGKEAEKLGHIGSQFHTPCTISASLETAIRVAWETKQPGDIILFSPGGSSFDLFKNYQERGNCFKAHVMRQWSPQEVVGL